MTRAVPMPAAIEGIILETLHKDPEALAAFEKIRASAPPHQTAEILRQAERLKKRERRGPSEDDDNMDDKK